MSEPIRVAVFSVVPSPYQRDLLGALAQRPEVALSVYYQERQPHDSPWPEVKLASYEHILPGFYLRAGSVRSHVNWSLPRVDDFDLWVMNGTLTSLTAQWLMRCGLNGRKWLFWGERLKPAHSRIRRWLQNGLASALSRATGIISIGSQARADYERRFPELLHVTVPYHTKLEAFVQEAATRTPSSGGEVTFLFCGQMIERKGIDLLLASFDRLVGQGAQVRLLLVGREASLREQLGRLSAAGRERVTYAGFQPPEELPRYFAKADVFVIPSRHDGWGVVVNQAMAAGLPVLASDQVGAACDLVEPGGNGLIFPAGDVEALYCAMRQVVEQPTLLSDWGQRSSELSRRLTPEAGAGHLVGVIQKAMLQ